MFLLLYYGSQIFDSQHFRRISNFVADGLTDSSTGLPCSFHSLETLELRDTSALWS